MNSLSVSSKNWILRKYNQEDVIFFKDNFFLDEIIFHLKKNYYSITFVKDSIAIQSYTSKIGVVT